MKTLKSFEELANAFRKSIDRMPVTYASAAAAGSKLVEEAAKHKLGTYQPEIGPFNEWDPLKPATIAEKQSHGYADEGNDNPLVRTGGLRDSVKSESSNVGFIVGSDSEVAILQELGTRYIPPRPFLGPALFETAPGVVHAVGSAIERNLAGSKS